MSHHIYLACPYGSTGSCCCHPDVSVGHTLTLLHSERPKLYAILVFLSAVGLKFNVKVFHMMGKVLSGNLSCTQTILNVQR